MLIFMTLSRFFPLMWESRDYPLCNTCIILCLQYHSVNLICVFLSGGKTKPQRPCIFCGEFKVDICTHLLSAHRRDPKVFRKINTDGDKQHIPNDLDKLVKWSEKWQMLFNLGKYKCLHRLQDTELGCKL